MKKLLVLLTACVTICAFGSCSEKEESSVEDNSVVITSAVENSVEESSDVQVETQEYDNSVDKNIFVGKWECTKFTDNGEEYTNLNGIPMYILFQYDFLEDGNVGFSDSLMEISDPENPIKYTWGTISDSEIEVASSGGNMTYTLENGQLVNRINNQEIYLDRVETFQEFDFKAYYEQLSAGYSLVPVETDASGNVVSEGEPIPIE